MVAELGQVLGELRRPGLALTEEQKLSTLRGLECFQDFSEPEVREILKAGIWEHYQRGDSIIEEGTPGDSFYILIAGEVSVKRAEKELNSLAEGECFGEMGYLSGTRRFATIVAKRSVTALKITGALRRWASLPVQMRLTRLFQQTLIRRLADTSKRLLQSLP
jgi:CRP-like cAMP-binding protein